MKGYTVILTHAGADLDAISSQFACSKLYPNSFIINPGSLDINAQKIVSIFGEVLKLTKVREIPYSIKKNIGRFIIVDTNDFERIGEGKNLIEQNPNAEIVVFDHHQGDSNIPRAKIVYKKLGANTTLIVDLLKKKKVFLSPFEATLIAFGIFEDTGSFSFPSTTQDDFESMSYLFSFGVDMKIIHHYLSPFLGEEQISLLRMLLEHYEEYKIKGSRVVIACGESENYIPGLSLIAHKLIELVDADIVFVIFKIKKDIYIIGRSTSPDFNLAPIMSQFGGGGHPTASSSLIRNKSIEYIKEQIINSISLGYFPVLKASHIMSSPVKTVHSSTTVREALTIMVRMGYSGLPVEENNNIVGMVSKRDLEKVLLFDKRDRPVKQFISTQIVKVSTDADLREIEEAMIKKNVGRVLVEKEGEIKGIISRSDLLRAYKIKEEISGTTSSATPSFFLPNKEFIQKIIERTYPKEIVEILKKFGKIAEKNNIELFLVGGAVRDLLLDKVNLDFDFVSSDALKLCTIFKKELKGNYRFYNETKTVHFSIGNLDFDFATARREYYIDNSLVPIVETASIKEDLARRDFTVNAIAINLRSDKFGEIVDFYGGYSDLIKGKIRVINNMSFIEDPSRILRAIKYMVKLKFTLSDDTEYLMKKAVELNVIKSKKSQRIIEELYELFESKEVVEILKVMSKLGITENLFYKKEISKRLYDRINKALYYHKKYDINTKFSFTLFFLLLENEKKEKIEIILNFLSLRQTIIRNFINSLKLLRKFHRDFERKSKEELFFILRDIKDFGIISQLTKAKGREKLFLKEFMESLRNTEVLITGKELIQLGIKEGPIFRKIFNEILKEKIKGKLKTKEDEIKYIKDNISKYI